MGMRVAQHLFGEHVEVRTELGFGVQSAACVVEVRLFPGVESPVFFGAQFLDRHVVVARMGREKGLECLLQRRMVHGFVRGDGEDLMGRARKERA